MRWLGSLVLVAALGGSALADKKIQDLTPGFAKEAAACAIQKNGLVKVVTGAKDRAAKLTDAGAKAELEGDVAKVEIELAAVEAHCTAVQGLVDFLKENADATYKKVEKQIDERDNSVRKLRKASKKAIEEGQPTVRKLIAKLAERDATATKPSTEPRTTPTKFPSKRSIDLPALPGSWKMTGTAVTDTVEYVEKQNKATVTARAFTGATCEQQRKMLAKRTPDLADLEISDEKLGLEWSVRAVRKDKTPHLVSVMCMPTKAGGVLATSDVLPATNTALADELANVMLAMLQAHAAQTTEP
jgi:hypothetical protein